VYEWHTSVSRRIYYYCRKVLLLLLRRVHFVTHTHTHVRTVHNVHTHEHTPPTTSAHSYSHVSRIRQVPLLRGVSCLPHRHVHALCIVHSAECIPCRWTFKAERRPHARTYIPSHSTYIPCLRASRVFFKYWYFDCNHWPCWSRLDPLRVFISGRYLTRSLCFEIGRRNYYHVIMYIYV
jgi:hypothetical protein